MVQRTSLQGSLLPVPAAVIEITNVANDYNGVTIISGTGSVVLGASGVIPDTSSVNVDDTTATLDLNNFNESLGALAGEGRVNLGTGTLTTGLNGGSNSFHGNISGSGSVVKEGDGLWSLRRSNSYSGSTIINGGGISLQDSGTLGAATSGTTVNSGAFLWLSDGVTNNEPLAFSGTDTRLLGQDRAIQAGTVTFVTSDTFTVETLDWIQFSILPVRLPAAAC